MARIMCITLLAIPLATYLGYPFLLWIVRSVREFSGRRRTDSQTSDLPSVSLVIAAYNEESLIAGKMENSIALDYPRELLQIIVVSDCSVDRTDEIVESFHSFGVKLVRCSTRRGKTGAQNQALSQATSDIIVYSDADFHLDKNAIRVMVRNFEDPSVGCVGGRITYTSNGQTELVEEKKIYEAVDQQVKKLESDLGACIGVDGAIYAIRKDLAYKMPEHLTTDFAVPLEVIRQGYRVIYDEEAVAVGTVARTMKHEFRRKVRTVRAGAIVLYEYAYMLNPFRYGLVSVSLLFHKLFRWIGIIPMTALFVFSFLGRTYSHFCLDTFFAIAFIIVLAAIGYLIRKTKPVRLFTVPFLFIATSFAAALGLVEFARGKKSEQWAVDRSG